MSKDALKPARKNSFWNMHLTTIISMSLVLFLIGLVGLLFFVVRDMTTTVKENMSMTLVLNDQTENGQIKRIENFLTNSGYAKTIQYISKDDALKEYIDAMGEDPQGFLGYNPLMASLEVNLNADYANTDSARVIEQKLKVFSSINKVSYQKDMMDFVNHNVKTVSLILLAIAAVLLFVSIALMNNTIRLMIYADRFLINTMKLVGATPWFIRRPYIKRSILNGFIASILAIIYLFAMLYFVQLRTGITLYFGQLTPIIIVSVGLIAIGIILVSILSYLAVGRYLRMTTNRMYLI